MSHLTHVSDRCISAALVTNASQAAILAVKQVAAQRR
jgi:hypothetical protein